MVVDSQSSKGGQFMKLNRTESRENKREKKRRIGIRLKREKGGCHCGCLRPQRLSRSYSDGVYLQIIRRLVFLMF